MATVTLIGSTGMTGSHILNTLLAHPEVARVDTISRRHLTVNGATAPNAKLTAVVNGDTSRWAAELSALSPPPSVFISALGTTRSAAGGFEQQHKLEHGVNVELARAAREAGTRVYVLISSAGADKTSVIPYTRMKGEIEDDIKALGFERTILVRPGLIAGDRVESRPLEMVARYIATIAGKIHSSLRPQDANVVGTAAVQAGLKALQGDVPAGCEKVWILNVGDIIRLGRTN